MKKTMKRSLLSLSMTAVLVVTTGCMGSFALTKAVYGWNDSVTGSKHVNNIIFWVLGVLQVYGFTMAADLVVLNTIEFWTGTKLLGDASDPAANDTRVVVKDHGDGTITVERDGATYVIAEDGVDRVTIVKDGELVGSARKEADGSVTAYDVDGNALAIAPAETVMAAEAGVVVTQ